MTNTLKIKKIILFNKETGGFFGVFDSEGFDTNGLDDSLFLFKEVEMSETEFWYGDYQTGKIYDSTQTQIVTQTTLRDNAIKKIYSKYFYIDQIKIITDQLKVVIGSDNQTQDFKDMVEFIDAARAEYHLQKEAYSSNPEMYIYIPDEEAEQQANDRYEGLF
jgi:hypothetical protein